MVSSPFHDREPAGDGGLFLGLISGTSVDGIDAALVSFAGAPKLVHARTYPMHVSLAEEVLRLSQAQRPLMLDDLGQLDTRLGQAFAEAANALLGECGIAPARVAAIGSHGQTLRHLPSGDAPFTMQLADASQIAERTGITTVADFRRRDVAAGGQGAPLVPAFHAAVLSDAGESRAVLNIGGIANLTLLPVEGAVRGFDTGPGNGLMDAWCLKHRGERFDRDGAFGAQGTIIPELLASLLDDAWLALPPPKSTGRDHYHLPWLEAHLSGFGALAPQDVQATLVSFTAESIAQALKREMRDCRRVLVCGGGVHNPVLMRELSRRLPGTDVGSTHTFGIDPDFMEAMAFAWLARETLAGRPGNLASVTGAHGPRILGAVYPA
ncbi:anhydro-N-acetylmuramic acid kinase [Arenimonas sp.]|uniref:anhydro-N-acetylmuramic acid kinase n=1 Tax=Arenimonas sp. TaxID=1872635 RepID=UPI0039E4770E